MKFGAQSGSHDASRPIGSDFLAGLDDDFHKSIASKMKLPSQKRCICVKRFYRPGWKNFRADQIEPQ